ncbi:hypothetical protein MPER_14869, partial [Moniliophthora perniciosa FA553]
FGLIPLCILFALKAPPFAVFALPFTTQLHFDKLSWLHKWYRRPLTGEPGYTYAWRYEKFFFGWIVSANS